MRRLIIGPLLVSLITSLLKRANSNMKIKTSGSHTLRDYSSNLDMNNLKSRLASWLPTRVLFRLKYLSRFLTTYAQPCLSIFVFRITLNSSRSLTSAKLTFFAKCIFCGSCCYEETPLSIKSLNVMISEMLEYSATWSPNRLLMYSL
jgi:hypothetical protein